MRYYLIINKLKNWLKSQSKLAKIVLVIAVVVHLFITILEMPLYWFKIYGLEVYLRGFAGQFLETLLFILLASLIIALIPYFIFRKIAKKYENYLDYASIIFLIISAIILYFAIKNSNAIIITGDRPSPINNCPVSVIGGKGERIYLSDGTIYVWKDDLEKKYYIVQMTVHFPPEVFKRIKCYRTEEEAIADGYKIYSTINRNNEE
ncbi:MAG: hypothetical protein C0412_21470 [Flavobacterium sp.]|nr:hypothetical protein [Flavobacterium sp.]